MSFLGGNSRKYGVCGTTRYGVSVWSSAVCWIEAFAGTEKTNCYCAPLGAYEAGDINERLAGEQRAIALHHNSPVPARVTDPTLGDLSALMFA